MEQGQETMQSENEVLPFSVNYAFTWIPSKKCNQTNTGYSFSEERYPDYVSCFQQLAG